MTEAVDDGIESHPLLFWYHVFNFSFTTWIALCLLCLPFVIGSTILSFLVQLTGAYILMNRIFFGLPSDYDDERWTHAKKKWAKFAVFIGRLWNGYEFEGLEKLPIDSGALLVAPHAAMVYENVFATAYILCHHNLKVRFVLHRFFYNIPVLQDIFRCCHLIVGSRDEVVRYLKKGYLVIITPGGEYEGQLSNDYVLRWESRKGFARTAIEAKVPIVPIFTKNVRQTFKNLYISKRFTLWLYKKTKVPFVLFWGGFPVKLKTYVGDPIPYDPAMTPEELKEKAEEGVRSLMKKHQRLPGSVVLGILERFYSKEKDSFHEHVH